MATVTVQRRVITARREDLKVLAAVKKPYQKLFNSDTLRVVAFSDYRVQDHSLLVEFVRTLQPKPNLIVYAGDDVERFHSSSRNFFEELAALTTHGACAVVGNDFSSRSEKTAKIRLLPEVKYARSYITGKNVFSVHERPLIIGTYAVIGSEGAPHDDMFGAVGIISYPERLIETHLRLASQSVRGKRLIILSHAPPRGVLDSAIRFGKRPIGSVALRKFLKKRRDVCLVVCGHVHSCGAKVRMLNRCHIINAASHDDHGAPGRVAVIEIGAGIVRRVEWHQLWELASIPGIRDSREQKLRNAGIRTIAQLHSAADEEVHAILRCGRAEAASLRHRALALLKQEVILRRVLEVPPNRKRAYLDIETDSECKFIWLVGVHVETQQRSYSFFADSAETEQQMLAEFVAFANSNPDLHLLSYSNSRTEQRMLTQRLTAHNLSTGCAQRIRDLYYEIHSCAAFPVQSSMELKTIASFCGFKSRTGLDGFQAAMLYASGRVSKRNKKTLLTYNEDDLLALKQVVLYLENLSRECTLERQNLQAIPTLFPSD